jgi:hypothetical protein
MNLILKNKIKKNKFEIKKITRSKYKSAFLGLKSKKPLHFAVYCCSEMLRIFNICQLIIGCGALGLS